MSGNQGPDGPARDEKTMEERRLNCRDVEERLAPYVDGEAAPETRGAIDAHLSACPPCRQEADHERAGRDLLHACRQDLRGAAPEALRARCAAQCPGFKVPASGSRFVVRRWVPLSVAASVLLAIAVVFALGINDRVEALAAGLALDHVKCFKIGDSEHAVDASTIEQTWERDRGWPIRVAQTDGAEQLQLVGVRRCLSSDGMTAHVMYRWHGQPLSVYVLPRATADDRVVDSMGHAEAIWSVNGRTYAVVADDHPAGFTHLVSYVKDHTR